MAEVVGVIFPGGVKVYNFDPAGLELSQGERVVVQTSCGPEIGEVVEPPHTIDDSEVLAALKKVQRVATEKDLEAQAASRALRREAMATCRELIRGHGLDMKLVDAEVGFGAEKITFSFFSEERVDFRNLVADLAKTLKMRIELRQVGAREEARMVGGLGPCGRGLCCTLFQGDDDPVSIRMAKEQNLPLNPTKISGLCGRLMCCLKYEQAQYVAFRKEAPAKGTPVSSPTGEGVVAGYSMTKESITVRMEDGSYGDVRLCTCQCQKDGTLLVVPEEEPPAPVFWLDGPAAPTRRASDDDESEYPPVGPPRVVLGENGEPAEVAGEDGSRPPGSRRSRGRRRGRGRGQGQGPGQGQQGDVGTAAGQPAAGGPRGGGQRGGAGGGAPGGGQRGSGDGVSRPAGSGQPGGDAGEGSREGGGSGAGRSRRRRRPRRPGGGAGGAPGGGSAGANGGGAPGGGAGGGGAGGGGQGGGAPQ